MRHGRGGGGPLDQINLDVPQVGMISSITMLAAFVALVQMPFRHTFAFAKVCIAAACMAPLFAVICDGRPIYVHPLADIALLIVGAWISDDVRKSSEANRLRKQARNAERHAQARAQKIQERKVK